MKRLLPFLLLLAGFALCSCNSKDITLNTGIDAKLRAEIKQKNDSLIEGLQTSKKAIFVKIASKDFVKSIQAYTNNIWWLFRRGYLDNNYKVYDEFEVRGAKQFDAIGLQSGNKGYTFLYSSPAQDSYVSLLEFDFGDKDTAAIAVVYGLIDGKWQICDLEAFNIKKNGKTALDIYNEAKAEEEAGHSIDAAYYGRIASGMLDAYDNKKFKFDDEKKIRLFAKTLENNMGDTYNFPHEMEDIPTRPAFTNIYTEPTNDGLRVTIGYQTRVDINNLEALDKEYEKVRKAAHKYFALNFKKNHVTFEAFNREKEAGGVYETHSYKFSDDGK